MSPLQGSNLITRWFSKGSWRDHWALSSFCSSTILSASQCIYQLPFEQWPIRVLVRRSFGSQTLRPFASRARLLSEHQHLPPPWKTSSASSKASPRSWCQPTRSRPRSDQRNVPSTRAPKPRQPRTKKRRRTANPHQTPACAGPTLHRRFLITQLSLMPQTCPSARRTQGQQTVFPNPRPHNPACGSGGTPAFGPQRDII